MTIRKALRGTLDAVGIIAATILLASLIYVAVLIGMVIVAVMAGVLLVVFLGRGTSRMLG
jgi:hypothetical protein